MPVSCRLVLRVAALWLFLLCSGDLFADGGAHRYLLDTNLALVILPPPPEPQSREQVFDLQEVVQARQARTEKEETLGLADKHVSLASFVGTIKALSDTNLLPRTRAFFGEVVKETDAVVNVGKETWKRPRPYIVDTNLFEDGVEKLSGSYPSGHSTRGMVCALLLAELFPQQRDPILARGRELGWRRILLGKHYPTDVFAGRVLAQAIVRKMKENHTFRSDFIKVKREINLLPAAQNVSATKPSPRGGPLAVR